MKSILEFNLPEETLEAEQAINAARYVRALSALDDWARQVVKYSEEPDEYKRCAEDLRAEIREQLEGLPTW